MINNQRTWIEISGAALRHNFRSIKQVVGPAVDIMPIVKANAYGHGLKEVIQALSHQPHWGLGVAYGSEALEARALKYRGRVTVLSHWQTTDLSKLLKQNVELVVWDEPSLSAIRRSSTARPKIHIKLDTGTTRVGFLESQLSIVKTALNMKNVRVVGMFSHLANAEEAPGKKTHQQIQRFTTLMRSTITTDRKKGITPHLACTAAILRYPEARFGLVRLGIGLYGIWPSSENRAWCATNLPALDLQPALRWFTRLIQVKSVPAGTSIGYGGTFRAKKPMRVGLLPVGYADGFDRRLSNCGTVFINGRPAPVVGRVCMNLTMVDLTKIPSAKKGHLVTLIGPGATADEMANHIDSINYEVTTRINWTIPRYLI